MTGLMQNSTADLFEQVRQQALAKNLLPAGSLILAAVSGGADSLAMLLILAELEKELSFVLHCLHINHGLRGATADQEEAFVADQCRRLGIKFYSRPVDTEKTARQRRIGLEEAGRDLRRQLYFQMAAQLEKEHNMPVLVALAHHLDDQAESLLLHLGRGSGLDGLSGMRAKDGCLVRPLLGCRRPAIEAWLRNRHMAWCHDKTNDELFTIRNKIRHQVLPAWQEALGYDPAPLLARAADNLTLDRSYLEEKTSTAYQNCRQGDALLAELLLACHPAIANRVLRLFWQDANPGGQDLGQVHIHNIMTWLAGAKTGQSLDLPRQQRICFDYGLIRIKTRPGPGKGKADKTEYKLALPGLTDCLNFQILAEFIENEDEIIYNGAMEYFRYDQIQGSVIRRRLPGDRIRPHEKSGSKSLKKFFQERAIPASRRQDLLLLAQGHDIVWLPGLAAGAAYLARPGQDQGRIIRLQLIDL